MTPVTNTIYGIEIANCVATGIAVPVEEHVTLNEKLKILENESYAPGELPKLAYLAIGDLGHRQIRGPNGRAYNSPVDFDPKFAAPYSLIPHVIRFADNDLTAGQRENYALRREEVHLGRNCIAYYLRRNKMSNVTSRKLIHRPNQEPEVFIPTSDVLNPTHPPIPPSGATTTSGEFLSSSMLLDIGFDKWEVQELLNVGKILYGSESYSLISELVLVFGKDRVVTIDTPAGRINFKEVIRATTAIHISCYYEMAFNNQGFEHTVDLASAEPLMRGMNVVTVDKDGNEIIP